MGRYKIWKIILWLLVVAFFATNSWAQEILIKQDKYYTELYLKIPDSEIKEVTNTTTQVKVYFNKNLKESFENNLTDPFIEKISGSKNILTVTFKEGMDFTVFKDEDGLKFISTHKKSDMDVLMSYEINEPMLRKKDEIDIPEMDIALKSVEEFMNTGNYTAAISKINEILDNTTNAYYRQEGLFRLGKAYYALAPADINAYAQSADAMDKLVAEFPDSSRVIEALKISAQAKEGSSQLLDAAQTYRKLYEMSQDGETKRNALEKIGSIYSFIGQYDKAIAAYEEYIQNFQTGKDQVKSKIGNLYLIKNYKNEAYSVFKDLPTDSIIPTLERPQLLTLANIFYDNGDKDKAKDIFKYLSTKFDKDIPIPEEVPNTPETAESLYKYALLLKDSGDLAGYEKTLDKLINFDTTSQFAQLGILSYVKYNIGKKNPHELTYLLKNVYQGEDPYNLKHKAELLQIDVYTSDNDTVALLSLLDTYLAENIQGEGTASLHTLKENILFNSAVKLQQDKKYPEAIEIYNKVLSLYPDSSKKQTILQSIDDIKYDIAFTYYNEQNYSACIQKCEERYTEGGDIPMRWKVLYEEATYRDILNGFKQDMTLTRLKCRKYMTDFPHGRHMDDIKYMLSESFRFPFESAFAKGNYATALDLYEQNLPWLEEWNDKAFSNNASVKAATSLYELGMKEKSKNLFTDITPMMTNQYAILGFLLCESFIYDINKLKPDEFKRILSQSSCSYSYKISLADRYTNDISLAASSKYNIIKDIDDAAVKNKLLSELSDLLDSNQKLRFDGFENIYFDLGMERFKLGDYRSSAIYLKKFADNVQAQNPLKPEGTYYLGKSLINIGDKQNGFSYYESIVKDAPTSVYASTAKSEMDSSNWKQKMAGM